MKSIPVLDLIHTDQSKSDPAGPASPARRALNRRGPAPLALEPRVMFDGATADAAMAAAKAAAMAIPADLPAERTAGQPVARDGHVAAAVLPPEAQRQDIVFIEDNVPDYQKLAAAVQPGTEVVVLDHTKDGLQQMIAALDGHAPVDAIHLVTHGAAGQVDLGSQRLSVDNLDTHADRLAALGAHLTAGGDFLIYGCDVGQDEAGARFVSRMAQLTGADVAASTDITGSKAFGGNWTLEAQAGSIETQAMELDRAGWQGEMASTVFDAEQRQLNFDGTTATRVSGSTQKPGSQTGDVVRFHSVITIGGQAIDAEITTTLDNSTITTYDSLSLPSADPGSEKYFQPNMTVGQGGGGAVFTVKFYLKDTQTAVTLQNVVVNSYDIDGVSGSNSDRQFQEFRGFSSYQVSTTSYLKPIVQSDGSVRFLYSPANGATNNQTLLDNDYRVQVFYDSMSSFQLRTGAIPVGTSTFNGTAYFSLDFQLHPWNVAEVASPAPKLSYRDTIFTETGANNGAVMSTTITLSGTNAGGGAASFAGTNGQDLDVSFGNLPAGLTAHVTRTSATTATLSFSGNALAHTDANDIGNFGVTFNNAAFTSGRADAVTGASRADLGIDFNNPLPDNTAPAVTPDQVFSYAENRSTTAGAIGTVAATDAAGVTGFRFAGAGGTGGSATSADGWFSIDAGGGIALTDAGRIAAANDYERGTHSFTHAVQAVDAAGNWSDAVSVTLNLVNVDDIAPAFTSGASANALENQPVLYTAAAVDAVDFTDKAVTYSLKAGVGDAAQLGIDADTGIVRLSSGKLDFETKPSYAFTVVAQDASGNRREQAVTVAVADADETAPSVAIGADRTSLKAGDSTLLRFTFSEDIGTSFTRDDVVLDSGSIGELTRVDATHYTALYTPAEGQAAGNVEVRIGAGRFSDLASNPNSAPASLVLAVDTAAPRIIGPDDAEGAASQLSVPEGSTALHTFTANEGVTWSLAGGEDADRFTITPAGTLAFREAPDYEAPRDGATDGSNTYLVQVRAVDAAGNASVQAVRVGVTNVNEQPVAAPDAIVTPEDTAWQGRLPLAADPDGDSVTYTRAGGPAHGTLDIGTDGGYTYTPARDFNGTDSFSYTVSDGHGGSNTYTVGVTVTPVNDDPTASGAIIEVQEDTPASGTLPPAADADSGDTVTYARAQGPAYGSVEIDAHGGYTYTPARDYNGSDSFTYTVSDGHGGAHTYTVEVNVAAGNDAPVAADDAITTTEDTAWSGALPTAADIDAGDGVTYAKARDPAYGTVSIAADGSYRYTPAQDYHGTDSFAYTVSDGHGGVNTYTVGVTVTPLNDAPVAAGVRIDTLEDTPVSGKLPLASDADGDPVRYAGTKDPAHGTVSIDADGKYTYTPAPDYHGTDSFTYTVDDGHGGTHAYTVEVNVAGGNDAPVAADDAIVTPEDTALAGKLPEASDIDGDAVRYAKAGGPAYGTVTVAADGGYTYTPAADYHGADSFQYSISDGKGGRNTYTVSVTVTPVNDVPVAANLRIETPEDTAIDGTLPSAADRDGDPVSYAKGQDPAHGSVVIDAGGRYRYTPAADYNGADRFTYTVGDGRGGSATYTVEVTVGASNDAPLAGDAAIVTQEDNAISGALPAAADVDGDAVAYARAGGPAHGTVVIGADGGYTYTPAANYNGADSFSYTVSDGKGSSSTHTVAVTVQPVNDAPLAQDAAIATREDTPLSGMLPAARDADGDGAGYAVAGGPAHGTVAIGSDGSFTYTPAPDYNGTDSFRYTVSDGKGGSTTYTVAVTVDPVNDVPLAQGGAAGAGTVGVPLDPVRVPAFGDVDGPAVTYTATLADGAPLPSWLAFDPVARSFTGTPPQGSAGSYAVLVTGSDGALSATAEVRIEVTNPAAPAQPLTIGGMDRDTGASAGDFVTADGAAGRIVSGSLGAPLGRNEVVQVSFDGGASWQDATTSGTGWSAVDNGAHTGNWTIEARVANTAAGLHGAATVRAVVLDTAVPSAPTVDSITTTSTTPVLSGGASVGAGETLQVTVNGATYDVAVANDRWTLDLASATPVAGTAAPLAVGQHYDVTASITDLAGNVRSGANTGNVDVSPPVLVPDAPPAAVQPVVQAPAPAPVQTPVAEPAPVAQALDTRVRSETAPGSLAAGDSVQFGYGQGKRADDQPALDLRGAALSDVYTRTEGFRTVVAKAEEPALVLFQGVPDQFAESGHALSLTVPADAFAHTQPNATVRLTAVLQDGRPLPAWVQFNGQSGQFTGHVPKGLMGELKIKLIARDAGGHEATALFRINVGQQRSSERSGERNPAPAAPAGKAGLSAQLRARSMARG